MLSMSDTFGVVGVRLWNVLQEFIRRARSREVKLRATEFVLKNYNYVILILLILLFDLFCNYLYATYVQFLFCLFHYYNLTIVKLL